jgi:hypothetical protein
VLSGGRCQAPPCALWGWLAAELRKARGSDGSSCNDQGGTFMVRAQPRYTSCCWWEHPSGGPAGRPVSHGRRGGEAGAARPSHTPDTASTA